jgi:HEPN domain-containing protein
MKEKVTDWLKVAETDINVAEILINHEHLAPSIAFHCQQAIEKSLKAILEENDAEVPEIHRLITLFGLMPDGMPTKNEIHEIVKASKSIFLDVRKSLT